MRAGCPGPELRSFGSDCRFAGTSNLRQSAVDRRHELAEQLQGPKVVLHPPSILLIPCAKGTAAQLRKLYDVAMTARPKVAVDTPPAQDVRTADVWIWSAEPG